MSCIVVVIVNKLNLPWSNRFTRVVATTSYEHIHKELCSTIKKCNFSYFRTAESRLTDQLRNISNTFGTLTRPVQNYSDIVTLYYRLRLIQVGVDEASNTFTTSVWVWQVCMKSRGFFAEFPNFQNPVLNEFTNP